MFRFPIKLLLLLAVSIGLYAFATGHLPQRLIFPGYAGIGVLVASVTLLVHMGLSRRAGDSKAFIRYYMGSTSVKLLLYLLIVVVFSALNRPMAIPFALGFLYFYLVFTAFEVAESYQAFGTKK